MRKKSGDEDDDEDEEDDSAVGRLSVNQRTVPRSSCSSAALLTGELPRFSLSLAAAT
jgi:hypothetical protein